jgi:ADP-dependent NAD(P)H-hydrate dehydratase
MSELTKIEGPAMIQARPDDSHKGTFGRVLVLGGSRGMVGAPALCASAAFRAGAGLVHLAVPEPIQLSVAVLCECATSTPLSDAMGAGELAPLLEAATAIAVGPGWGVGPVQQSALLQALACGKPLVIDADGLNNLAAMPGWASHASAPIVLTPHPGEFARLTGRTADAIAADRQLAAVEYAKEINDAAYHADANVTLVLKGAGTIVTDGAQVYVNQTGNAGLATGGTGDVLTGLIAGRIAAGETAFEAAVQGTFVHGMAGDIAAKELSQTAMMATDLLETIPHAIAEIAP